MLEIDVITIFPALFESFLETSFVGQAREKGLARISVHDLRDWATNRHRSVDDSPYGGGAGMVMMPDPLVPAIESLASPRAAARETLAPDQAPDQSAVRETLAPAQGAGRRARVVALSPQGRPLQQRRLEALAREDRLVLVCGRYEGIDQRVLDLAVDEEISIGDYVLSGGEVPAMVLIEGLVRLLPGVLGNPASAVSESFGGDLLEGPQYTRPPVFRGHAVPDVLRSGDHAAIARWRDKQAVERTRVRRPDMLARVDRGADERPDAAESGVGDESDRADLERRRAPERDSSEEPK